MQTSRGIRAVRALIAASVATGVALAGHLIAGGALPHLLGILVPLTVSTLWALTVIGRTLSVWRISAVVITAQALFHWLFVLGSTGSATGMAHDMHGHSLAGSVSVSVHSMTTPSMSLGHLIAAVLTIAALVRGERVLRGLVALARMIAARLQWPIPVRISSAPRLPRLAQLGMFLGSQTVAAHSGRGPPVLI